MMQCRERAGIQSIDFRRFLQQTIQCRQYNILIQGLVFLQSGTAQQMHRQLSVFIRRIHGSARAHQAVNQHHRFDTGIAGGQKYGHGMQGVLSLGIHCTRIGAPLKQ